MILTGTMLSKSLLQVWAQLKWLDEKILGIRYATAFMREYCILGGFEGRVIIGHKNVEGFRKKIAPFVHHTSKEEAGILPKVYEKWKFDLAPSQKVMLRGMRKDLIAMIETGDIVTASNAAVAVMKMQQIANGFAVMKNDDGSSTMCKLFPTAAANPRIIALKECLESIQGKVVIWARFVQDIAQIKELLGDACVLYYGSVSEKQRALNLQQFKEDPKTLYFVSNPQVGGTGIDGLQKITHRAVYYSNSDNSIDRWQSEDRISRIAEIGGAILTDLIAIGSPDAKILRSLKTKEAIQDMAIGDIKKWLEEEEW
jgi:SNF2 family DNA or RNA helicase